MPFLVVPVGVFVLCCKLPWKEAKLGDLITLALESPKTFSVGVETEPSNVEERMGPRPAFHGFPIGQSQGGWRELVSLGCRLRQEEVVLDFAPVPTHPNQSSRGPPCGASQEQPHKWCPAPTLFPWALTPLDTSQNQRHSRATTSLHPSFLKT